RERTARGAALLLPALVFGVLVVAQVRAQQNRSEIAVRYNTPLTEAASSLQREQDGLKVQLAGLRASLDAIGASAASQGGAGRELQARIDVLKEQGGLTPRSGAGVAVLLDDSRGPVAAKDVDKAICHATDITDIVNTAWRGGAQAVAVNDERIVGTSSVYCVGSTIMVNGTLLSPPFQIAIVGPQNALLAVFDDPSELRDIKQRRDAFGLGFRVSRAAAVRVPAYSGALTVKRAEAR
ncbi:MAG: DUF881 domain-containing protein, partial [Candidatus Limnocylindria bacterium]|nr:DUF881 domain-containing protein [Candidatus Limnocylindria bacterium]